jgi:flagellar hook-associated protein 2
MGTITSGTGLISGLDIKSLVTQLIAIESKVKDNVVAQSDTLTKQQTALKGLQAYIMAIQVSAANFNKQSVFQQKKVTSSDETVLTASATKYAAAGSYQFQVKRLASNYHSLSGSYSSLNSGIGQGILAFEIGSGQMVRDTDVQSLNGGQGIGRGTISITDRAGHQAQIDLSTALTMTDVLKAINQNGTAQVTASVSGDHLVLTDASGGTGNLIVADVGSGSTAQDLGITGAVASNTIAGRNIHYVTEQTLLKDLNDGNGVRGLDSSAQSSQDIMFSWTGKDLGIALSGAMTEVINVSAQSTTLKSLNGGAGVRLGTIRITDQNGVKADIDLTELGQNATMAQLRDFIQLKAIAAGMKKTVGNEDSSTITLTFNGMDHISVADSSALLGTEKDGQRKSNFIIEDLNGGHAASDLGIVNNVNSSTITGDQVWKMENLGDVINAVNNNWANIDGAGNKLVELAVNDAGTGLKVINHQAAAAGSLTVKSGASDQWAGEDLGLLAASTSFVGDTYTSRRLIGGLNSVLLRSLNGGNSRDTMAADGTITYGSEHIADAALEDFMLRDSAGNIVSLGGSNLADVETMQDLIEKINGAGVGIKASINNIGNGVILTDTAGGAGTMAVSGSLAAKLNIAVDPAAGVNSVDSGNLQLQNVSRNTLLSDLRQGQGVRRGSFTIKDSTGHIFTVNLASDSIKTVGDVVDEINGASYTVGSGDSQTNVYSKVKARINDAGDGILLYDTSDTPSTFTVSESGGQTAHDLGILGTAEKAADNEYYIDGTNELKLDIGGGDGIEDIVSMINQADMGIQASIVNTGTSSNPAYRISFNSEVGGRAGRVYIDAGGTSLTTQTLSQGEDALVLFGEGTGSPVLISSNSNTLSNVVKGLTVDLAAASDEPVKVTVEQDLDSIVTQIQSFVDSYNTAMKSIASLTSYDSQTQTAATLFADSTARAMEWSLESVLSHLYAGSGSAVNRLSQIGVTFSSLGTETGTQKTQDGDKTINYAVAGTPQLPFDEDKFRQAVAADPDAVTNFFTQKTTGFGDYIANQLEKLAGTTDSTTALRLDSMADKQKMFADRIEYLTERLTAKETSLYNQFYAMETALAKLQSQQSSLSQLSSLITSA